jgi:NADH:ubiquinone oxidoreductase subunit F (NADH-binding)
VTAIVATRSPAGIRPRLLAGVSADGPTGLVEHEMTFGPLPLGWRPRRLIDIVERSGLVGRGGAGFPTGRKLRSVADGRRSAVVVANGAEGEPASAKDRFLLTWTPNLVMDGIAVAAHAVGATEAYLVVHHNATRLGRALQAAAEARNVAGIDQVPIEVVGIPDRYTSSEQSAIVQFLSGGPARPTFAPPRPHERGVAGRPTLVNNVETLAHLALIAR